MVMPQIRDRSFTRYTDRLSVSPYSLTSCESDFPPRLLLTSPCFSFKNHLLNGSSTTIPTATAIRPTGRKVKKPRPE